ncbi:putative amidase [Cutaneotrichosporon oleaginosum]|uniref:amidase n=1 Tax=Cutaneotrichosporon oleaginosum TaxID=879819 RepID=A0A0J1B3E3_9TREE|nr:putative amidase [Cutaneotrichosporon oleaginosum]KLT42154.1 putative amidase [Cutaneotrichosporon oleaginosum]
MSPAATKPPASELIAAARRARDETIPVPYRLPKSFVVPQNATVILESSGLLTPEELKLVDLDATALAAAIKDGTYTSVQATTAYLKTASLAQQGTNCLVELFPEEALERAAALDAHQAAGKPLGALHGVPVSIKDHIDVEGHDSPSGFLSLVGKMMAATDANLVAVLRAAGAVFYCKTTNPQSLMHLETECYLGITTSPYNNNLTAGGSSGGEGALIGMKGSPLGVGTDIGGSVRSPAAACGIYSFKPSVGRVSFGGCVVPIAPAGCEAILGSHGPMGRSARDMELYMRIMAASEPWRVDPTLHVKPWREVTTTRKLRIGVLRDDGVVLPVAPIRRALETAVEKLKATGEFEIVEYKPLKSAENWDIISKLYWLDNGKMVYDHIAASGEPIVPLTDWIIQQAGGVDRTKEQAFEIVAKRDAFRAELARYWHEQNVDVVLSPVGPSPAPQHGTARYWNYTSYWNLANYPAAIFPTGLFVDPAVDKEDPEYTPRNEKDKYVRDTYDADVSIGAPLCLQVVGYLGYEEETLDAFKKIDAVVNA